MTTAVGRAFGFEGGALGRDVVTTTALTGGVGAGTITGSVGVGITVSVVADSAPFGVATLVARASCFPLCPCPSTNQIPTALRTTATTTPSAKTGALEAGAGWTTLTAAP